MLLSPSHRLIAHVDMNSYFASVEQQANPTLRGKPLGVCAYLHGNGCVIAASIEAKRFGISVGMTAKEARAVCPHAIFVQNDPGKYRTVTKCVFGILGSLTDRLEPYSIDEAFLDLTGWYRDAAEAAWALARARQRITDEAGEWLRCSIGIAPTRFLAKTASKMEKPSGLTVIDHSNLDDMLGRLRLQDLTGIGPRMERRFRRLGIHTPLALKQYPLGNLMRPFGKYGFMMWGKLHGWEPERVVTKEEEARKSIGHSYCLPDRINDDPGGVLSVLVKLTERAGRRLRAYGFLAGTVSVAVELRSPSLRGREATATISFPNPYNQGVSDMIRLSEPASDSFTLVGAACDLLRGIWHGERVRFLAVTLSEFSTPSSQMSFSEFSPPWAKRESGGIRRKSLSEAVDAIRDRYGDEAIMFGSMFGAHDHAPDRIGFRKTEGLEVD